MNRHIQVFHGKRVKSCSLGCHFCEENILNKDGVDTNSVKTQTDTEIDFKCNECNFEGRNEEELSWHMKRKHGWSSDIHYDEEMYDLDAHNLELQMSSTEIMTII